MEQKVYRVLGSTSLGYTLYDVETSEMKTAPHRKKIVYHEGKVTIGDEVLLDDAGFIKEILPRRSALKRPRLANCDRAFVVQSLTQPEYSSYLLEKFLSELAFEKIPSGICLTKADLLSKEELLSLKERTKRFKEYGIPTFFLNAHDSTSFDFPALFEEIKGKSIAFVGQTGAGKSSLLNAICPDFERRVDALYVRSGRGRHTTKEVILLPYQNGFLFDTPGFSSLDLLEMTRKDLSVCFPGFKEKKGECYFTDCLHEEGAKGCAILPEIGGMVSEESYDNYLKLLEEVKENERWKKKL